MEQNYQYSALPTSASTVNTGHTSPTSLWQNTANITADDGSSATWGAYLAGQGASIIGSDFNLPQFPEGAVIDGIEVFIDGAQVGCFGDVNISVGSTGKPISALNGSYGGPSDLWGASEIAAADLATISVSADTTDQSGGDGIASIDYMQVTVFWHIEMEAAEADVPTRVAYKVYSRDGNYLGELPKVTSKFAFAQDINSAGSQIVITCARFVNNEVTVSPLLTEAGDPITTEDDLPILSTSTNLLVTTGDSPDEAIFKNSNRVKVYLYNRYYPNGRIMFSGQINRVNFKYGAGDATVKLTVYSDGLDLNNYIARGYPFNYTTDTSQISYNGYYTITQDSKGAGWQRYGQTWQSGASVDNIGEIVTLIQGSATVTLSVYDGPNGNFIASMTKNVNNGVAASVYWQFPQLVAISPSTEYFFAVSVAAGQSIRIYRESTSVYANGSAYSSSYSGGSGGGSYFALSSDLFFAIKYGLPTTTATYSSDDPVTEMAAGILLDYNSRGGLITARDLQATGLSLTYTFVVAFIYDAIQKILELSPTGYYSYIDLGTAEIDIKQASETADFTVVRGRHITELNLSLTIEQVKNYLLLSGGETGGNNLYRDYTDSDSVSNYGIRTSTKSDNRVTVTSTADAIGNTFTEENASEVQETSLIVKDEDVDISQFIPGKTIGFRNFGNFIDDMVLQIVRREPNFSDGYVVLTLGRLPVRMNDVVQRINRELMNEQTINNPNAPS